MPKYGFNLWNLTIKCQKKKNIEENLCFKHTKISKEEMKKKTKREPVKNLN